MSVGIAPLCRGCPVIRKATREPARCYQQCSFCKRAIYKGDVCVHIRRTDERRSGLATICVDCVAAITQEEAQ